VDRGLVDAVTDVAIEPDGALAALAALAVLLWTAVWWAL
jgi:hypothetical protein